MRRIIIFTILVVMLLSMYRLSQLAQNWHYVVSSEADTVLYATSFEDADAMWKEDERSFFSHIIEEDAMRITVNQDNLGPYSVAEPYFSDFDMQVKARTLSGSFEQDNTNAFGVIFRQYNLQNYYLFLISGDGWYQVLRIKDGQEKVLSAWNPSDAIKQGIDAVNHLRVVGNGDTFRFFVNDQQLELCVPDDPEATSTINPLNGACMEGQWQDTMVESTHPYGRIGVVVDAEFAGEDGVAVAFDDVIVTSAQITEQDTASEPDTSSPSS